MINTYDVVQLLPISSFKFNDNTEEMRGTKTEKKTSLKSESSIISGVRREGYEVDSDLLPGDSQNEDPDRNPPEVSSLIAWEDSEDKLAEYFNCPKDLKGSEEGENLYTRENIMEYELPELDVFFHESSYQFVKDICIDSGVSSQGKCLLETYELDHTTLSCILNSDVDTSSELTEETLDTASFGTNGSRHSTEQDCNKDVIKQCGCEGLTMKGEIDIDAGHEISDQSHKKIISKILLLDREVNHFLLPLFNSSLLKLFTFLQIAYVIFLKRKKIFKEPEVDTLIMSYGYLGYLLFWLCDSYEVENFSKSKFILVKTTTWLL